MAIEINLLSQRNKNTLSLGRALLISRVGATIILLITISLGVVSFFLVRDPATTEIASTQQSLSTKLALVKDKGAKVVFVHDKIKKIDAILSKQFALENILITSENQLPLDVTFSTLVLNKTQLQITISSSSLTSIQAVTDNFTNLISQKKLFKQMTLQGIIGNEKAGTYGLTIVLTLL